VAASPPPPAVDGNRAWARAEPTRADLEAALLGHVAGWRDKYPDVPVEYAVSRGDPGTLLTAWSRHAQLVVVGCRGHGTALRSMLGSVTRKLIRHAGCPVLIARPCACS
jgi:nucleotide-binding universal stress UspA family protein